MATLMFVASSCSVRSLASRLGAGEFDTAGGFGLLSATETDWMALSEASPQEESNSVASMMDESGFMVSVVVCNE